MIKVEPFVEGYSTADCDKIKFDWNGKHGDKLEDPNMEFRVQVCEYLREDFSIASDELIIDLFQEISKSSKETWGVYRWYHLFAQEVLNRGKTKYLYDYLKGAKQSFDTLLASSRISITKEEAAEIVAFIEQKLATELSSSDQEIFSFGLERFKAKLK